MPAAYRLPLSSTVRPKLDTNMFKLVVFCALASVTAAQYYKDSKEAAIITDTRYLQGNGRHGSQYDQEDGINFKEETDQSGNRVGSYSYIDPSGQKRTISYTAGKDGFRATGDGVPVAPAPVAPLPQYNPPAAPAQQNWNQQQWTAPAVTERNWDENPNNKWDQWDDPGTWNSGSDQPAQPQQPQPQWNNQQNLQWTSPAQGQQWNQQQAQPQWTQPAQPQTWDNGQYEPTTTTTPAPHRFYPPGRLNLNRSPDGFSYTFNKT